MALTFVDQTFDTRTVSVVAVGSDWIQESALAEIDKKWLEAALAEASLSAYTIPNLGVTADVYFAPFIKTTAELEATFAQARIRSGGSYETIADLSASVADHEARITALEP